MIVYIQEDLYDEIDMSLHSNKEKSLVWKNMKKYKKRLAKFSIWSDIKRNGDIYSVKILAQKITLGEINMNIFFNMLEEVFKENESYRLERVPCGYGLGMYFDIYKK